MSALKPRKRGVHERRTCARPGCNTEFLVLGGSTQKYCCLSCSSLTHSGITYAKKKKRDPNEPVPTHRCENPLCGKEFPLFGRPDQRFCSRSCSKAGNADKKIHAARLLQETLGDDTEAAMPRVTDQEAD